MDCPITIVSIGWGMKKVLGMGWSDKPIFFWRIKFRSFIIGGEFVMIFLKLFCLLSEAPFLWVVFVSVLVGHFFLKEIGRFEMKVFEFLLLVYAAFRETGKNCIFRFQYTNNLFKAQVLLLTDFLSQHL